MTVERIHPKAPVMLIFIAIFTYLPSCINLSNIDINRFAILIIIKKDWELQLDKNFMNLFGFSKSILNEGYHKSNLTPNVDKIKFLKFYYNLVVNEDDNRFLTDVSITGNITQQVTYENDNIYKTKKNIEQLV